MRDQFRDIATNLTPVRVVGVPGLTLVLIAVALALQFPEARWLIAGGLAGGAAVAAVLISRRRTRSIDDDDRWSHGMLGVAHDDTHRLGALEPDPPERHRDRRRDLVCDRVVPLSRVVEALS